MEPRLRKSSRRAGICAALVGIAVAAALVPLPAPAIEHWYSTAFYERLQSVLTPLSNSVPVFLLDVASSIVLVGVTAGIVRRWRRDGWKAAAATGALTTVTAAAVVYLVFLITWGLNYRRIPLEDKLAYEPARVTHEAALRLARVAVQQVNDGHGAAHAGAGGPILEHAFKEALEAIGQTGNTALGRPKLSVLSFYFRYAGIDGMTDPIFLDIVINPDVLPVERPAVLTHEWAHLAGYADEAEANFIAWLTCVRGDALAQYSGWLALYSHIAAGLPLQDRRALASSLMEGPRADLRAIAARHARGSPVVQRAQRGVYDAYLRANRTEEGIARYNAVTKLVLGTEFDARWNPQRR